MGLIASLVRIAVFVIAILLTVLLIGVCLTPGPQVSTGFVFLLFLIWVLVISWAGSKLS